ncbi:capsid cement protein [Aneurinibacillus danicus]|uniref:DUF2190 domain-containing protein n=1 Tax=Aneurinibacillus danicus TaxID=267746 RepID=A0A511V4K1_9BACL|nr:capsid cement protein [Aneurinibacillus danicus]GEN33847.1 hypothetical protein ADA01nite_13070 [Aneurinibacillus danicus]
MNTQYNPGHTITRIASAPVGEYRFVTAAGAQAGAGAAAIGVSLTAAAAAGASLTVVTGGTAPVIAGGAINAGDPVTSDAEGRAVPAATGNVINGVALEAAALGEPVEVLIGAPAAKA